MMLTPMPFQRAVISRLSKTSLLTSTSIYLALEQGLGKTGIALRSAAALDIQRMLVVAPSIGRLVWPAEAEKWLNDTASVHVPDNSKDLIQWSKTSNGRLLIGVISYDDISRQSENYVKAART